MKRPHPNWAASSLGEIGEIFCGQSVSEAEVNQAGLGVAYVTGPEQWDGRHVERTRWTEFPRRLVPEGCIFITVKGAGVGKTFPGIASAIGRDVYAYKASQHIDENFIHLAIRSRIASLIEEARGDIPGLSRNHLSEYQVGLPPLAEQRRIVAKLDALTARLARARAELERVPVLVDALRRETLHAAFSFPSSTSPLAKLATYITSGSRGWARYYSDAGAAFIRVGDVRRGAINLRLDNVQRVQPPTGSEGSRTALQQGDVVVTITADLGRVGVVSDELGPAFVNQHVALIRPMDLARAKWIAWYLTSKSGQQQLLAKDRGVTKAGLGLEDIRQVDVPLVEEHESREIIERLEAAFARADRLEAEAARARALLDRLEAAILAKAFRGELVPQDPADEPASVLLDRIRAERAATPKPKRGRRAQAPRVEP